MFISVIVTVYNKSEPHIRQCISSVLNQSLRPDQYEIIVVDDCSTRAETIAALDHIASNNERIQLIRHSLNLGPNEARHSGAKSAIGTHVMYVDGDDVLTSDAVESLGRQALLTGADVVSPHFFRWNESSATYFKMTKVGRHFPDRRLDRLRLLYSGKASFTMCGRLFERRLLTTDVFDMPKNTLHEDVTTLSRIIFSASVISALQRYVYFYRWTPDSITSRYSRENVDGMWLAVAQWIRQATQVNQLEALLPSITEGAEALLETAVRRAVYVDPDNWEEALGTLEYLWRSLERLRPNGASDWPTDPIRASQSEESIKPTTQFLIRLFASGSLLDEVHFRSLAHELELDRRPATHDTAAVLPEGLSPSEVAYRLKDKIVIICQVDYHFRNAAAFAKQLALRGYPCVVVDNSAFVAAGKRPVSAEDRRLLWRTEYLKVERPPYGSDWLCTARLVITFNDFNDDFREALEYRRLLGHRSVSMVEGINDFLRVDFDEPRYLPYRRCDTVFLAGRDDAQYFEDRTTYVIGLPVIEQLARKQPRFPSRPLAVLNVNFTYGVLEDRRNEFLAKAKKAFEQAGWDWVITQHPMDKGELPGLPVSRQTQYDLIDRGTVFVSRFATGILEALASGKAAVYFNPHGERVAKFKAPMDAFDIATTADELAAALRKVTSDLAAGVDFRARALPFLAHHTGFTPGGPTPADRFADAVVDIVESDPEPNRRVAKLFFERLEARDHFRRDAPGLVFGELDRRHYAQLEETDLVARYLGDRGQVMIDVGANIGQSADGFLGKGWTVHAFEPDPANRKRLEELQPYHPRLRISAQAVSDKSGDKVAFYASDESTGISSLSAFTAGHRPICEVETVTLLDYCRRERIGHVDFLKVDVEGHDKFVLDGFDWDGDRPDVVLTEFEDAKTLQNGYSAHDLAGGLVARGYSVYVSEWLPIERYGLAHDWCRLIRYAQELDLRDSWGNLIAFREDPDPDDLRALVLQSVKFATRPTGGAAAMVRFPINPRAFREVALSETRRTVDALSALKGEPESENLQQLIKFAAEAAGRLTARVVDLENARVFLATDSQSSWNAVSGLGYCASPEEISRNFALVIYMRHIFSNRPLILRMVIALHGLAARLLNLPRSAQ